MAHREPIAIMAALGFIALLFLFAALSAPPPWSSQAYAQANTPPRFSTAETTREVQENTPPFGPVGSPVTATDGDNDRLTYSLENAGTSHFGIDSSTGQLQAGTPLDYEARSTYTVTVKAKDPSGASASNTVTINVANVDEPGRVSLSWTKPQVGTELEASLTDPDGGVTGTTWQWSRSDSNNGSYSDISGAASAAYTPAAGDTGKYLRATASYTDGEGLDKTARATSAGGVREAPDPNTSPTFETNTDSGYNCGNNEADVCLYVKKHSPAGSSIYYPAYATDDDRDQLRYSLSGADDRLFSIGPLSGNLFTTEAHAYDDPGTDGIYEITITATDPSDASDDITVVLRPSGSLVSCI